MIPTQKSNNMDDVNETLNSSFIISSKNEAENLSSPKFATKRDAANHFLDQMYKASSENPTSLEMAQTRLHLTQLLADQEDLIYYMEKRIAEETNTHTASASSGIPFNVTNPNGASTGGLGIVGSGSILRAWESLLCYRKTLDTLPKNSKKFYVDIHRHREEPFSFTSVSSPAFVTQLEALQHIKNRLPLKGSSSIFNLNPTIENIKLFRLAASPTTTIAPHDNRSIPKARSLSGLLDPPTTKKTFPSKTDEEFSETKKRQRTSDLKQHENHHHLQHQQKKHFQPETSTDIISESQKNILAVSKHEVPDLSESSYDQRLIAEEMKTVSKPKTKHSVRLHNFSEKYQHKSELKTEQDFIKESISKENSDILSTSVDASLKTSEIKISLEQQKLSKQPKDNNLVSQKLKQENSTFTKNSTAHNISQMSLRHAPAKTITKHHIEAPDIIKTQNSNDEMELQSKRSFTETAVKLSETNEETNKEIKEQPALTTYRSSTSATRRRASQPPKTTAQETPRVTQKEVPARLSGTEPVDRTTTTDSSNLYSVPSSKLFTPLLKGPQSTVQTKKEIVVSVKSGKGTGELVDKSTNPELTRRRSFTMTRRRSRGGKVFMEDLQ